MDISKDLAQTTFNNREYLITHLPYEQEMEFYQSIKMGNIKEVKRLLKPLGGSGFGRRTSNICCRSVRRAKKRNGSKRTLKNTAPRSRLPPRPNNRLRPPHGNRRQQRKRRIS